MHINNPDALKQWLTVVLEPLCDADPPALARYVLALLKKEKSTKELVECMNEQLDVFLGVETKAFLDRLFVVIASEEYLNAPSMTISTSEEAFGAQNAPLMAATSNSTGQPSQLEQSIAILAEGSDGTLVKHHVKESTPPLAKNTSESEDAVNKSPLGTSIIKLREVSPVRAAIDSDHHGKPDARNRNPLRTRSRSRSRSHRDKYGRPYPYRNKSPSGSDGDRDGRRKGGNPFRRGDIGRDNVSSKFGQLSNEGNSPDGMNDRRGTRSLSPASKGDRCRDFDEKGYCMRGETCPWDHGVNPVVLEDLNNPMIGIQSGAPRGGEYNPDAPEIWTASPFGNGAARVAPASGPAAVLPGPYPRQPPGGTGAAAFRGGPPYSFASNTGGAITPLPRELISVPVVEANSGGDISSSQKRRYEPEDTVAVAEGPTKRKPPINSRLGHPGRVALQQNCSLELRKVPRGLNSIAHLNNHFCKFGKIVNIQVSYEGDPEAAIITFSTHAEANVAYRSTEAVLNNRFIKVFWHTSNGGGVDGNHNSTGAVTNAANNNTAGKDELNTTTTSVLRRYKQYSLNNTLPATPIPTSTDAAKPTGTNAGPGSAPPGATVVTGSALTKNNNPSAQSIATAAAARMRSNRINRSAPETIRKKKEEQVKAAVQLAHGLHKRKHELLQGYLKQMRSCVEKVERMDNNDSQRPSLLTTIKALQSNIDTLNKEIASDQAQITASIQPTVAPVHTQHPYRKSKELQKKELLDIELELIAQQQEGNDTTAIQKRIEELQRSLVTVAKPAFVARNARVRPAPPGSTSVDRRPTTIVITGYPADECDTILGHFKHFGEITKHEIEQSSVKLTYATRLSAEQAMLRGRRYKESQLQITWFTPNAEPPKIATEEDLLDENATDTAEIRLEDEEEDEDEDRSWRR